MKKFKYPLSSDTWNKKEVLAIQDVIKSKKFTMGKKVENFEKAFSKYIGSKYCIMVNSGSSANLLMVASLFFMKKNKLKRGDEVIVPAISWSTTFYPLSQYGLKLKFVDIDLETLNFDLDQLSKAITKKTKLIMVVNLLGNPNNFNKIKNIIKSKKILMIEDNCESLGAEFQGKKTGTFGIMGSYSTFYSHHISTMEGGIVATNNEELYHILLSLRAHGWTRNLPKKNVLINKKHEDQFYEYFRFILPGYNLRPLEISGAVGIEQLKKLPNLINKRRKNAVFFTSKLKNHPKLLIQKEISKSSWFGFSLIVKPNVNYDRKKLINELKRLGFECRPIVAGNFTESESYKYLNAKIFNKLNIAKYVSKNGVYIGNNHHNMRKAILKLSKL